MSLFEEELIESGGLRAEGRGFVLSLRLPWYRALPLSTVEIAELRLDGRGLDADGVELELNGKRHPLRDLPELVEEWWYVLDSARVHVDGSGMEPGEEHEVEVTLNLYPPYIPGLIWVTRSRRVLRAH